MSLVSIRGRAVGFGGCECQKREVAGEQRTPGVNGPVAETEWWAPKVDRYHGKVVVAKRRAKEVSGWYQRVAVAEQVVLEVS